MLLKSMVPDLMSLLYFGSTFASLNSWEPALLGELPLKMSDEKAVFFGIKVFLNELPLMS